MASTDDETETKVIEAFHEHEKKENTSEKKVVLDRDGKVREVKQIDLSEKMTDEERASLKDQLERDEAGSNLDKKGTVTTEIIDSKRGENALSEDEREAMMEDQEEATIISLKDKIMDRTREKQGLSQKGTSPFDIATREAARRAAKAEIYDEAA
jgi:hypothetical protein